MCALHNITKKSEGSDENVGRKVKLRNVEVFAVVGVPLLFFDNENSLVTKVLF